MNIENQVQLEIDKTAIVCSEAILKGNFPIIIKSGTVIHPKATVDSQNGPIIIGPDNIIEEFVLIKNIFEKGNDQTEKTLEIGENNLFEVKSEIYCSIGNFNCFETKSFISSDIKEIGNLNKFGVLVHFDKNSFFQKDEDNNNTKKIYERDKILNEKILSWPFKEKNQPIPKESYLSAHKKQLNVLQNQLPRFHKLYK